MYNSDYNRPPEEREPIETEHFHVWDAESPKPPRKKSGAARFVALGLCCALVGGLVGGGGVLAASHLSGGKTTIYQGTSPNSIVSLAHVDGQTVLSPEQIYAANLGATVGVNGNVDTNVFGYTVKNAVSGSGFVIGSNGSSSYILTNYHVIDGVSDIKVFFSDGKSYDATLVGGEKENDIAVLKIDVGNLQTVTLGDSDQLNVGEDVYAIGNPLGELTFTFTGGYVSAKDRSVTMSDGTVMNMLQTDTAINSGNSGGPLFNEYGQVIGIVSAKLSSSSNSEASVEGLGFAIPINDVKDMVTSIIEHGYVTGKPNVGILMKDVPQEAQQYGVPAGSEVLAVLDGSGAGKAGLQAGDIITAVNGTAVSGSEALKAAVQDCKAGDKVTFSVYRDGDTVELEITLDEDNQTTQEAMEQLQKDYQEQQAQQEQQGLADPVEVDRAGARDLGDQSLVELGRDRPQHLRADDVEDDRRHGEGHGRQHGHLVPPDVSEQLEHGAPEVLGLLDDAAGSVAAACRATLCRDGLAACHQRPPPFWSWPPMTAATSSSVMPSSSALSCDCAISR